MHDFYLKFKDFLVSESEKDFLEFFDDGRKILKNIVVKMRCSLIK